MLLEKYVLFFVSLNRYYLAPCGILIQIWTWSFLASLSGYHFLKFLYVLYIFYRTFKEISTRIYWAIFFKLYFSYIIFNVWVSACCIFKSYVSYSIPIFRKLNDFKSATRSTLLNMWLELKIFSLKLHWNLNISLVYTKVLSFIMFPKIIFKL